MKAYSKEFYEAQSMFEKVAYGHRLDKPSRDQRERLPAGQWYDSGETNNLFAMFLHGCEYGEKIAAQNNEERQFTSANTASHEICPHFTSIKVQLSQNNFQVVPGCSVSGKLQA